MKNLSIGSSAAWQISANEAAGGNFQFIEKEHVFIGILSLDHREVNGRHKAQRLFTVALMPLGCGFSPRFNLIKQWAKSAFGDFRIIGGLST